MKIDFVEVESNMPLMDLILALGLYAFIFMLAAYLLSSLLSNIYPTTPMQSLLGLAVFRLVLFLVT